MEQQTFKAHRKKQISMTSQKTLKHQKNLHVHVHPESVAHENMHDPKHTQLACTNYDSSFETTPFLCFENFLPLENFTNGTVGEKKILSEKEKEFKEGIR